MPFISYAQNFEDLMLHRALRDVKKGVYIDLGAADPDAHSVTRAFYERGWRGINVEPNPWFFGRLTERRPDDVNLNVAVSDSTGEAEFFCVGDNTGLSTLDPAMASSHASRGQEVRPKKVRILTLADVCRDHVGDAQIHFLKLDVEGHELAALQGHDFARWRPWIIVAEAHDEQRTWDAWEAWHALLEQNGYRFVYQDGVNRFYLAHEKHDELAQSFVSPPNCYDDWVLAEMVWFRQRMLTAEQRVVELQAEIAAAKVAEEAARAECAALHRSISWRVTAPLRAASSMLKGSSHWARPHGAGSSEAGSEEYRR